MIFEIFFMNLHTTRFLLGLIGRVSLCFALLYALFYGVGFGNFS